MDNNYIEKLLDLNILTEEKLYEYPLRLTNLNTVIKIYAINNNLPYRLKIRNCKGIATKYYLTDKGLQYVYNFFKSKSLDYVRHIFIYLFTHATEDDLKHLETYSYFENFRGTKGVKDTVSKEPAVVIRKVGRVERVYKFNSIREARLQLNTWLTLYPIEQFKLYRIRTDSRGYKYKSKMDILSKRSLLYSNTRGDNNDTT